MKIFQYKSLLVIALMSLGGCSTTQDSNKIAAALKEVCDCEEVIVNMTSQGLTLSKEGSNTAGERHEMLIEGYSGNDFQSTSENMLQALRKDKLCEGVFISIDFKERNQLLEIEDCSWVVK